jgi:RNA polymerase sigma-70 factor (ECF subfamily)
MERHGNGGPPLAEADELLRRCQRGDAAALMELVRLFEGRIFRLAYGITGDPARAEEATADALARVWATCGQWRGDAAAGTWIYRVAVRVVLDSRRKQRRGWPWSPPSANLPDPRPGPVQDAIDAEGRDRAARRVREAVATLPEADRALVHLYYFEQRGLAEIAVILGSTRDALKMRLSRTRDRLRDLLRDCDGPS